jgi:predicted nucleic acid-binding protein
MSADSFFDTSVLLYILSRSDPKSLITTALLRQGGVISVQVLNEFANVASRKFHFNWDQIEDILAEIREFVEPPMPLTVSLHEFGMAIAQRYKYRVYDSLLIASALQSGCTTLYSEDMQDGQTIGPVTIRNPFAVAAN